MNDFLWVHWHLASIKPTTATYKQAAYCTSQAILPSQTGHFNGQTHVLPTKTKGY